jgi:hypothetical protein
MLMAPTITKTAPADASSVARHSERAASLNADGTQKWFIPPFVIPAVIVLLVAGRAIYLS